MNNASILSARPIGDALDIGPALVSDLPDMPRFHLWQGRSHRRYLATVYEIDSGGLLLRANNLISGRPFREGEAVTVGFSPRDCVLLDAAGLRIA